MHSPITSRPFAGRQPAKRARGWSFCKNRVFARISSRSFQRLPMAVPRQAMTRRHVRDARSTRGRRRRSNVLTKSTFTVFIGLACSRETPFGSVRSGSSDGNLPERGVSALFGAGCQINMLPVRVVGSFSPLFFSQKNTKISATRIAVNSYELIKAII